MGPIAVLIEADAEIRQRPLRQGVLLARWAQRSTHHDGLHLRKHPTEDGAMCRRRAVADKLGVLAVGRHGSPSVDPLDTLVPMVILPQGTIGSQSFPSDTNDSLQFLRI